MLLFSFFFSFLLFLSFVLISNYSNYIILFFQSQSWLWLLKPVLHNQVSFDKSPCYKSGMAAFQQDHFSRENFSYFHKHVKLSFFWNWELRTIWAWVAVHVLRFPVAMVTQDVFLWGKRRLSTSCSNNWTLEANHQVFTSLLALNR